MYIKREYYDEKIRLRDESIFTCASGKLGVRGNFEEGYPEDEISIRGTYINGFCETEEIKYNEKLYGFTNDKQTIVNLPDSQGLEIWVDDEKLCCWNKAASKYSYVLDMEHGEVLRSFIYETQKGRIQVNYERFTSFTRQGLFAIRCTVKSIDFKGTIKVVSTLNGEVKNFTNSKDPRVASGSGKMLKINIAENRTNDIDYVQVETINSSRKADVFVKTVVDSIQKHKKDDNLLISESLIDLSENLQVIIDKYCFYTDVDENINGIEELEKLVDIGFNSLKEEQASYLSQFWANSRVLIDSEDIKQENLDLCLYEMLCSAGRDGKTSIAAKGLSGEGYEGQYFWDCETYIFPFFLNTNPDIAKALLEYRYSKLDYARQHAKTLGHKKGALYPWRTITGSECSSYFPSGSAQYHINGDISRAFIQYWRATKDISYLSKICEVLVETSRLWMDVGHYLDNSFRIDCVTGPDEYTCMVNNNYYTNAGAKNNLLNTYKLVNILKKTNEYPAFVRKLSVTEEELQSFKDAGEHMYLPYDEKLGIIKQDDSFLDKKHIDLNTISSDEFPMLLHYHPLYLNRVQICKQADAILADYLFGGLNASTSMRTLEYYDPITTHDSSLSKCIFGNVSAKLGDLNRATRYFVETLDTDVNDHKGNTKDGLHIANMGGCYDMIVGGFAGLKIEDEGISLFPMIPESFKSYKFNLVHQGTRLSISVDSNGTTIYSDKDSCVNVDVYGQKVVVTTKPQLITRKIKGAIFDLDGVITDTAKYHYQAWKKIADELCVDFNEEKNEKFKGVSRKTCLEQLLIWGNIELTEEDFKATLIRKNDYYKELLKNLTPKDILPGIKDTISKLHEDGIKVSLFSVSRNTSAILKQLEIEDIFDEIVCGNDIVNSKPHYEGYLLAADRMNIEPRLCVMIEDSESGIKGAKDLSMKTIAIMKQNIANADYCINSTSELKNTISLLY